MEIQKVLVTGGAGFIGSSLVESLIRNDTRVAVIDNLSSGSLENISHLLEHPRFTFIKGDLLNLSDIREALESSDAVFHLAANPDARIGSSNTRIDFENNLLATYNLLEAVRRSRSCRKVIFTSTSTVYGDAEQIPTPEEYGPLKPISLYGASKLACESLISGYSHMFGIQSVILRLANIVGPRSGHGVIFDFIRKLHHNPHILEVLGDGTQCKSYLHIDDCTRAIIIASELFDGNVEIYNVGSEDRIEVLAIANIVAEEMGFDCVEIRCKPTLHEGRGWTGDVKHMLLDISKIKLLGWRSQAQSAEAVRLTVRELVAKSNRGD